MKTQKIQSSFARYQTISGFAPILIIILIAALIVGGLGFFLYKTQYQFSQPPIDIVDETPQRITATPGGSNSEITSVDETWNLYTNNVYGYSIKLPKLMKHMYGGMCEWKEGGGSPDSYRPNGGLVPTKIFEDPANNLVYISSEYFYQMAGESRAGGRTFYSECNRVNNSLGLLEDRDYFMQQSWKFIFAETKNDAELELFIKGLHGSGCTLREQTPATQPGVFDVVIDASSEECFINSRTVVKYYPAGERTVYWNTGQAATFYKSWGTIGVTDLIYDEEMVESFRFLE